MGRHKLTEEQKQASRKKRLEYLRNYQKEHYLQYYAENKDKIHKQQRERREQLKTNKKEATAVANIIYEIIAEHNGLLGENTYINLTANNDIYFDADGINYEIKITKK